MAKIISISTGKEIETEDGSRLKAFYLDNFGTMTGLTFEGHQGCAEVVMTWPEIQRILEELTKYEKSKEVQNDKVIDALKLLRSYLFDLPIGFIANVVIGQSHVKIVPDPPEAIEE